MQAYVGTKIKQYTSLIIQVEEINQNIEAKEEELKRYWNRVMKRKPNRIFQNNERKFYHQVGGECTGTNQQANAKEGKQFLE